MNKFFKALFVSKKTLHPEGEKQITVFVTDELKKNAEIKAETELKFWDEKNFSFYKKPKMIELDIDTGAVSMDAYDLLKQEKEKQHDDDGDELGTIDDVKKAIVYHPDYSHCCDPYHPSKFIDQVCENVTHAIGDRPVSFKLVAEAIKARESIGELYQADFVNEQIIAPLLTVLDNVEDMKNHCHETFKNVQDVKLYSAGKGAPDHGQPKNRIVTAKIVLMNNEILRIGVGLYDDKYLASYDICLTEKATPRVHSIQSNITHFADVVFTELRAAILFAFNMAIDGLHQKVESLVKDLMVNDAQKIKDRILFLKNTDQIALFEKYKVPQYVALIPALCVMPYKLLDNGEQPKTEAPRAPAPTEFETGIIYAGKISYSMTDKGNKSEYDTGAIFGQYVAPRHIETKPIKPAETKPLTPPEQPTIKPDEIKPATPDETKTAEPVEQDPDLKRTPDRTPDQASDSDIAALFESDSGEDVFETLLNEAAEKEMTQIERDIAAQNEAIKTIASGESRIFDTLPNRVYHGSDGISSTMIKDACISLMYFNGVYNTGAIEKPRGDHFDVGNLAHTLTLEPEKVGIEYKVKPDILEPTLPQRQKFDKWVKDGRPENQNLKPAAKIIKAVEKWIEDGRPENQKLKPSQELIDKVGNYADDPANNPKPTTNQQQQYNVWFNTGTPEPYSGKPTDKQIADFEAWERAGRPEPYAGKPSDNAIERCEFWNKFTAENENLIIVDRENWQIAENMAYAVRNHPLAGKFINHPQRRSERSYYTKDPQTGLLIKARPDIELGAVLADLKTIQLRGGIDEKWVVNELRREILRRKYHVSAAMYLDVTKAKQFVWIFVNKEVGYHWVAVVKLLMTGTYDDNENYKPSLYEQGLDIYRDRLAAIKAAYDSNEWPEPVSLQNIIEL